MSEDWTITEPSVYPQTDRVVNGAGRIVREYEYWCVEYTASRPGYVDVDYCPTFTDEAAARAHVEKLRANVRVAAGLGGKP